MAWLNNPVARLLLLVSITIAIMIGCNDLIYPEGGSDDNALDGTIDNLSAEQLNLHILGDDEFARIFTPEDGLGPNFVAASCDGCHPGDAKGHPVFSFQRFGKVVDGEFNHMPELGGPQLQPRSTPGHVAEILPDDATGVSTFMAPAVTGLGFLEALDDSTIIRLADPDDEDGDGISGKVSFIDSSDFLNEIASLGELIEGGSQTRFIAHDGKYVGRFGKKAIAINLLQQTVGAYQQDMGLTTDLIPEDLFNIQQAGVSSEDGVPDPEVPSSVVSNVVFYLKTLRVPPRRNAYHPDVLAGEELFEQIGCASCHIPTLRTGDSSIPQLRNKEFHPYTDLLLHDMGPMLDDGYTEGSAETFEWRTPPLWGIGITERFQGGKPFFLHDGRAATLQEAISFHGGEAADSRDAFQSLGASEKDQLIQFLKSL